MSDPASSLVGVFFYFFAGVLYISTMPRRRSVAREVNCLSTLGGRAHRKRKDNISWTFSNVPVQTRVRFITPSLVNTSCTNDNDCSEENASDDNESSEENVLDVDDCMDSTMEDSEDCSEAVDMDSLDDSTVVSIDVSSPCIGNRIVNLSTLSMALQQKALCKNCQEASLDDFFEFCDVKVEEMYEEVKKKYSTNTRLKAMKRNVDVRHWHNEWIKSKNKSASLTLQETTFGLATTVSICCSRCDEVTCEAKKTTLHSATKSDLCQYDINLRFSLALQLMGVGGEHAAILTSFLDLPESVKWNRWFNVLEQYTHTAVEEVKVLSQQAAVEEEVLETINDENYKVGQHKLEDDNPLHRIQASFDMGWQVRSSGNKYGSPTGHALLIGARSKKVLDSIVYNKNCTTCNKHMALTGSFNGVKKHYCLKNYEGTSKSMEAAALVEMLTRAIELNSVSVCTIISDDDSNGRAKAQHVSNGGKLPIHVEEPKFLADPSHRKRVFARAIYNLASAPVKVSKVTKGLASHLKYCYGACVKRNRKLSAIQLSEKVYNILKHITDEHDCCDSAWCYDIKAKEEGKVYNAPKEHRIDKVKDLVTYTQIKKIFDQYACLEQMEYCNHPFDTQTNESLNQAIATVAPKHTCYSGSCSLQSRISIVIGVHNFSNLDFFSKLFDVMGIEMTECLVLYLKQRDGKKKGGGNINESLM
jgi:hypothetical protein